MEDEIFYSNKEIIIKILLGILIFSLLLNIFLVIRVKKYKNILNVTETLLQNERTRISKLLQGEETRDIKNEEEKVFVHITGEVKNPGVYEFNEPVRLYQIIEKAGGTLSGADVNSMNLVETIYDEAKIHIPKQGEAVKAVVSNKPQGSSQATVNKNTKININTASIDQLKKLVGIGDTKAKDIIAYREANGPFKKTEDIMKVKGIGPSTYDKIRAEIIVK